MKFALICVNLRLDLVSGAFSGVLLQFRIEALQLLLALLLRFLLLHLRFRPARALIV